jgi:hypothetical protein
VRNEKSARGRDWQQGLPSALRSTHYLEDELMKRCLTTGRQELHMRSIVCALLMSAAWLGAGTTHAQYAAQLYPYCSISSSSGATTCYFSSRAQCGSSCIANPWYIGPARAAPYLDGRRRLEPRYVRP